MSITYCKQKENTWGESFPGVFLVSLGEGERKGCTARKTLHAEYSLLSRSIQAPRQQKGAGLAAPAPGSRSCYYHKSKMLASMFFAPRQARETRNIDTARQKEKTRPASDQTTISCGVIVNRSFQ